MRFWRLYPVDCYKVHEIAGKRISGVVRARDSRWRESTGRKCGRATLCTGGEKVHESKVEAN
jgi:hypothetical protein